MKRKFWLDFWWLILFVFVGLVLTILLSAVLTHMAGVNGVVLQTVQMLQCVVGFLLPTLLWVWMYKKERACEVLHLGWPGRTALELTTLLVVVSLPVMEWLETACHELPLPQALADFALAQESKQTGLLLRMLMPVDGVWKPTGLLVVTFLLLTTVLTPVAEELLFRGGLLHCFKSFGQRWWVALCVGFIFAAVHVEVFGFIPRMLLGAAYVWLVWRTGSIWPAVWAHCLNNGFALLSLHQVQVHLADRFFGSFDWALTFNPSMTTIAASVVLTALVVWWMIKALPRKS